MEIMNEEIQSEYKNQKWSVLIDTQSEERPTRILRPSEFELILGGIDKVFGAKTTIVRMNQLRLKVALITGMRYSELQAFIEHPEWYRAKENYILMREKKHERLKRGIKRRYIRLPHIAREIIPQFFEEVDSMPSPQGWIKNLRRWAIAADLDPSHLSARTTRKTWESWLVFSYKDRLDNVIDMIAQSLGHTRTTMLKHYLNIPFTRKDVVEMSYWTGGWI